MSIIRQGPVFDCIYSEKKTLWCVIDWAPLSGCSGPPLCMHGRPTVERTVVRKIQGELKDSMCIGDCVFLTEKKST